MTPQAAILVGWRGRKGKTSPLSLLPAASIYTIHFFSVSFSLFVSGVLLDCWVSEVKYSQCVLGVWRASLTPPSSFSFPLQLKHFSSQLLQAAFEQRNVRSAQWWWKETHHALPLHLKQKMDEEKPGISTATHWLKGFYLSFNHSSMKAFVLKLAPKTLLLGFPCPV